jgi:fucose permease
VVVAVLGLLILRVQAPLEVSGGAAQGASFSERLPRRFWLFAAAVFLYGIVETLNGNWSGPYLTGERGVSVRGAAIALMTFWAMGTIGRVLFATVSSRATARWIYVGLPILLVAAFQLISRSGGETGDIAAFGVAGLGCSAFFPLCISLSGQEYPRLAAAMAGGIVAFYQAGYGVAAFGVGPLRESAGLSFQPIYSLGSVVAGAMFIVALAVSSPTHLPTKWRGEARVSVTIKARSTRSSSYMCLTARRASSSVAKCSHVSGMLEPMP